MSDEEQTLNEEDENDPEVVPGIQETAAPEDAPALVPENPLVQKGLEAGLSTLAESFDGLSHAFVKFQATKQELTDISILEGFKFLRYIDVTQNLITNLNALASMPELLVVKADNNTIGSAALPPRPYLQVLTLSKNRIQEATGIEHPMLKTLNLSQNHLSDVSALSPAKLPKLSVLELRGNHLSTVDSIRLTSLTALYLADNGLYKLDGIAELVNLKTLHLRNNKITSLSAFTSGLPALEYLNLRQNHIEHLGDINNLALMKSLKHLVLLGNPVSAVTDYRLEPLVVVGSLNRLDKIPYEDDEKNEATEVRERREGLKRQESAQRRQNQGVQGVEIIEPPPEEHAE